VKGPGKGKGLKKGRPRSWEREKKPSKKTVMIKKQGDEKGETKVTGQTGTSGGKGGTNQTKNLGRKKKKGRVQWQESYICLAVRIRGPKNPRVEKEGCRGKKEGTKTKHPKKKENLHAWTRKDIPWVRVVIGNKQKPKRNLSTKTMARSGEQGIEKGEKSMWGIKFSRCRGGGGGNDNPQKKKVGQANKKENEGADVPKSP